MEEYKICLKCNINQNINEYYWRNKKNNKKRNICKKCYINYYLSKNRKDTIKYECCICKNIITIYKSTFKNKKTYKCMECRYINDDYIIFF